VKGGNLMEKPIFEPIDFTPEKAERVKAVLEKILSRHTGTQVVITSYEITPRKNNQQSV
jgi:hypothetical protein